MTDSLTIHRQAAIRMDEFMTFNKLERLKPGHRNRINQDIRSLSKKAWSKQDPLHFGEDGERYIYNIKPVVFVTESPDPDAVTWIMKRCIDGAVDAGILPDDTSEYIRGITISPTQRIRKTPKGILFLQTFYEIPDELAKIIFG